MNSINELRQLVLIVVVLVTCWGPAAAVAARQAQPPPSPAQEGFVPIDQIQVHPAQERVVLGEPAGQRLGQRRDLRP